MRCLALAQAWQERGGDVCFVYTQCPLHLLNRLNHEGFSSLVLTIDSPGSDMDARETARAATRSGASWIVVDGYQFSKQYLVTLKSYGFRLLVIDDFADSNNGVANLILNQNLHATDQGVHRNLNSVETDSLMGPKYALLRREFVDAAKPPKRGGVTSPKVLLTLGGGDPDNTIGKLLDLLSSLETQIKIKVITTSANPYLDILRTKTSDSPHDVEILTDVKNMPSLYAWADGIISAGGSTCWEWMLFGLPAAVVILAENQRPVAESLTSAGYAINLGCWSRLTEPQNSGTIKMFLEGLEIPSIPPRSEIDGFGASRVAASMDNGLWLRRTVWDDCLLYFEWVNDPLVRNNSLKSDQIPFNEHSDWFRNRITSPDSRMYVGIFADKPVGQVRFERNAHGAWKVGFSISPPCRGQGLGSELLRLAVARQRVLGELPIVATAKEHNTASCRCFESIGFRKRPNINEGLVVYELED